MRKNRIFDKQDFKFFVVLFFLLSISCFSQNTFPPSGNVAIGNNYPVRSLEVGTRNIDFSAFGKFTGYWSTAYSKHGRIEFNDKNFGIGAGRMSTNTPTDDDLYLWSYNGVGRDISFLSTSDGESDPSNWNHNMIIKGSTGNVGIGTTSPDSKLAVNGTVHAKEVKVDLSNWSDFVFKNSYSLPTLKEVANHIKKYGHLKDIPSAREVVENGMLLGEMDAKLLQKIEELTLYTIQQDNKLQKQDELIAILLNKMKTLEKALRTVETLPNE